MKGRWLSVDPGETVGWALWEGAVLLVGGQTPMWEFVDDVYDSTLGLSVQDARLRVQAPPFVGIERLVVEDFRLYPWLLKDLEWDAVRTARAIGALELIARQAPMPITLQGASIKEDAERAGAEALFVHPLHENRHQNDAIRHGVYFMARHDGVRHEGRAPSSD